MGERKVKAIVRHLLELERPAHLKTESSANQDEWNVVERVAVAFAQFICPNDQRVIEQTAAATRLGCGGQFFREVIQLPTKPFVNLDQFALGSFVLIWLVRERVMIIG